METSMEKRKKFINKKLSEIPISKKLYEVNLDDSLVPIGFNALYGSAMSTMD